MLKDKRKQRRRPIRYTAWLALAPDELIGCELSDISDTGARIDVEDTTNIPDGFFLFLSSTGAARRRCSVIWRKPHQLGVKFELNYAEPSGVAEKPVTEPA
jgi:hypothetical protein